MRPSDLATEQTLRFVEPALPKGARVLEAGCGRGALARRLLDAGFAVSAIDASDDAVDAARAAGVEAEKADFLAYRGGPFDAVLFTRSLHHMHPLPLALERAAALLAPGGVLVADEFAVDQMDRDTARWYYELASVLQAADLLAPDPDETPGIADPLERWRAAHRENPPLHGGRVMLAELRARFEIVTADHAPYLYRDFCERLEPSPRGLHAAERILEIERRRTEEQSLRAVGLRAVAKKK